MLVVGVAGVAALGVLAPRWLTRLRVARAVTRGLARESPRTATDLSRVAHYHRALSTDATTDVVDDATWSDLDLDAVFVSVDRTASQTGRQYLYHTLRKPHYSLAPLAHLEQATQRFAGTAADAARVRVILQALDEPRAASLPDLLFGELPARPTMWWIFPILTCTAFACLALIAVWPPAAVIWLAVCVANIGVQLVYRPRVKRLLVALQSVPALVRAAERLSQLEPTGIEPEIATLREHVPSLALLRRATAWLLFEPGKAHELVSTVYEYVNMLFLIDVNAFVFSIGRIANTRTTLRHVFDAIGRLDTAQSIACWRESLPHWEVPVFTAPGKSLKTIELFHPLLAQPVANSLTVHDTGILITGSNMAGKTTFMRTFGVTAVLAQTLHTVCARRWEAPYLCVRSSIGRSDSLLDGKSHYLAEVESVHSLLQAKSDARQHLFLLDEMFRGTNTAERVAAAYAVLEYLTRGLDIVVVATHDLELVELLGRAFETYHFREHIVDHALSFDYRLRGGPSSTRNAIALLKLQQYPEEIIANANAVLNRR